MLIDSSAGFAYRGLPWNIRFGAGYAGRLGGLMEEEGLSDAMILSTPRRSALTQLLIKQKGARMVGVFDQAQMHVPIACVDQAARRLEMLGAKCTVSIGGGSTTGLAKALSVLHGVPSVVLPTTYAGSEMTTIWAVTADGVKTTAKDARALPALVVYDPELTCELPAEVSALSGLNAIAQAVANILVPQPNPFVLQMAYEGVERLYQALPLVVAAPADLAARSNALLGASFAGAALGAGSTGLHHKLCHLLGGSYATPHAQTHAALLPYSAELYQSEYPQAAEKLAVIFQSPQNLAAGISAFANRLVSVPSLASLGLSLGDLDHIAAGLESYLAAHTPCFSVEQVRDLLHKAWTGERFHSLS